MWNESSLSRGTVVHLQGTCSPRATGPCGERLKKSDWTVRDVEIDVARRMVEKYHYAAGASNTATYLHGLFREGEIFEEQCCGVAWWLPPTRAAAEATYPERWQGVLCLSRLVIMPEVPKNACTFLLARSRALIDSDVWPCLVTYADDWRGHTGEFTGPTTGSISARRSRRQPT